MSPEVDPEEIPDELKERPQWLLWDSSADTPRRPHWKGNFGVSWNDPDDWHEFAEALAAVEKNGSWGLGFVVARDNDDHAAGLYGCLDLDGCAVEGSPKEWLPDLTPFFERDAYVEFSPSKHDPDAEKHGIRIPIKGFSPPEWWTDVSVPDADHEGIEAEGSKFQTFTGDTLRGAGEQVAEYGDWVDEWLMDAYEAIKDEPAPPRREEEQDNLTDYERAQQAHDGDTGTGSAEDIMRALDSLDARRVAEDTIVQRWNDSASTSGDKRAFVPTWGGADCNGTANVVDRDKWVDVGGTGAGGPTVMAAIDMGEVDETARQRDVSGSLWWNAVEHLRDDLGYDLPEPQDRDAGPTTAELIARHSDQYDDPEDVPEDVVAAPDGGATTEGGGGATDHTDGPDEATAPVASALDPDSVIIQAGLDTEDGEDISDLSDREKAAAVWEIIRRNREVHVRVMRENGSLWAYDGGVWSQEGERALRHAARKALGGANYGQRTLAELKAQARADPAVEVSPDDLGLAPGHVAVENGLLDLDDAAGGAADDALRSLEPDDYALTRLPVEYDPDAEYDRWNQLVAEWAEEGKADALQEYVGYCLHVGDMPIHRALLLVGSGANGKGTFLHTVRALLGEDNTTSIELQTLANERDAVADFYGAVANIDDDLSARNLGAGLGMFKKLVAGDSVRARHLYEDGFEYEATGKHLYAANEVPQVDVSDDDEAFWRRWLLVEFPNYYPPSERDPTLRDELTEPGLLSGILNWAAEGRARLLEQGYFTGEDRLAADKRSRWQSWGDSADKFIEECLERDEDATNVSTQQVHRRYAAWCRENGHDPIGQQKLTNQLKRESFDYGRKKVDGQATRAFGAMSFTDDVPALDETPERRADQQTL